jgi:predicted acetyltransferase
MWVRGGRVPCQGVAWVGTIKTQRRGGSGGERGIASQLMFETIRKGRERGEVVSGLMPFRSSFYEHFGYGMVERRHEWTLPLSILPSGDFSGMRFMQPDDLPLIQACHQRMVQHGHCDIERSPGGWAMGGTIWPNGHVVVDQPNRDEPVQSSMFLMEEMKNGKSYLRVVDLAYQSPAALVRQLRFLGSLRDQHSAVLLQLPADLPLNLVLKETQLPHRDVEHPVAKVIVQNRLQVRVLDHVRFLEAIKLPDHVSGKATVAVKECEGNVSTFSVDVDAGRVRAKLTSGQPQVECDDCVWAVLACGDVSATTLARLGLVRSSDAAALKVLDALSVGPAPFCNERS